MRVFTKANLLASSVTACDEPWKLSPAVWPEGAKKEQIKEIWKRADSRLNFLHTAEGVTASVPVSQQLQNAPRKLWCFVADYDAMVTPEMIRMAREQPMGPLAPAWACRTCSGGARLWWDFEEPITLANAAQAKHFLSGMMRRLFLIKWLPGFDATATFNPYQCFELGRDWTPIAPAGKVPARLLHQWLFEASKTLRLAPASENITIPLERIAAEVERRFPGRWQGPFDIGQRGVRFWDPTADNPTAAIVREDGMLCFTGDSGFMSWRAIFGAEFTNSFEAAKIEAVMTRVLWDEHHFWIKGEDDYWERWTADGFRSWLKCYGFSSKPTTPGGASQIDEVMVEIQARRRVRAALPFLFRPHGPWTYRNEPILNTSRITPLAPVDAGIFRDMRSAIKTFPFIWSFLSQFLELGKDGSADQLVYLLSWMKHFYETAYYQRPQPGQAIVLAGSMSRGKTFFASVLLARLMGGSGDGSDYVVRGSQWSDQVAKWPVLVIDDQGGPPSHEAHRAFSSLVKKVVANRALSYNGKWQATGEVEWNGRLVICCNDDPESIRLLPTMDNSISDKLSLLAVSADSNFVFPSDWSETQRRLDAELPYFARFLLEMCVPETLIDRIRTRFYLRPYHHPRLAEFANHGSLAYTVFEAIVPFLDSYRTEHKDATHWEGSATQLLQCAVAFNITAQGQRLTPRSLSIALGQMQARGMDVTCCSKTGRMGLLKWKIGLDLAWTRQHENADGPGSVVTELSLKNAPPENENERANGGNDNGAAGNSAGAGRNEGENETPPAGAGTGGGSLGSEGSDLQRVPDAADGQGRTGG